LTGTTINEPAYSIKIRDAAAENDAFLDRRARCVQAVVNAILEARSSVIYSLQMTEGPADASLQEMA
jgi:hypothetical protein